MDLKLLALVHDLHLQQYGKDGLHYDFETINDKPSTSYQHTKDIIVKTNDKYIQMEEVIDL